MTSKLKCPVCRKPLERVGTSRQYQCGTWGCDASFDMIGTEALWTALMQAKQDLEIATKALDKADRFFDGTIGLYQSEMMAIIKTALETIGKQKDNK